MTDKSLLCTDSVTLFQNKNYSNNPIRNFS